MPPLLWRSPRHVSGAVTCRSQGRPVQQLRSSVSQKWGLAGGGQKGASKSQPVKEESPRDGLWLVVGLGNPGRSQKELEDN